MRLGLAFAENFRQPGLKAGERMRERHRINGEIEVVRREFLPITAENRELFKLRIHQPVFPHPMLLICSQQENKIAYDLLMVNDGRGGM